MPSGLTYKKVAELCRFRAGASRAERLRFQALVNDALQKLSDKIALDSNRRQQMWTDRSSVTGTLTSGVCDLSALTTLNLNRIRFGCIYKDSSLVPMEWLADGMVSAQLITDSLDSDFIGFWVEGSKLYVHSTALSGTLKFAVPFIPTLTTLPADLVSALVDEVVAIAKTAQGSGWIEGAQEAETMPEASVNV